MHMYASHALTEISIAIYICYIYMHMCVCVTYVYMYVYIDIDCVHAGAFEFMIDIYHACVITVPHLQKKNCVCARAGTSVS